MPFSPGLTVGDTIENTRLCQIFGCGPQGGMRRALGSNSLVVVSNHVDSIYDDRWIDGTLHYTGMGRIGDQSLTFMQNKTLNQSNNNGVEVFLFEVFSDKKYTYVGQVQLNAAPYQELQPDEKRAQRTVWVFPLRLIQGDPFAPSEQVLTDLLERKEKAAERLSDDELRRRAESSHSQPGTRSVAGVQRERNPWVSTYVKRLAKGFCDLCNEHAPFSKKSGVPYLESHHVDWLARNGLDVIENCVALCPNCHRRMHVLDLPDDRKKLNDVISERAKRHVG